MNSDEELVLRTRNGAQGDLRAFEELIGRHQAKVIANCRFLTGSPDDAQDLAQEVFVKAYFALPKFELRAQFSSWLKRIKINHCLNFIRKKKRKSFVDVDDPLSESEAELQVPAQAERDLESIGKRARIEAVLASIPDTLKIPLIMRDLDGMSYQEIADELSLGLSAAKMRIKRGREEFRRLYGPPVEEERHTDRVEQTSG